MSWYLCWLSAARDSFLASLATTQHNYLSTPRTIMISHGLAHWSPRHTHTHTHAMLNQFKSLLHCQPSFPLSLRSHWIFSWALFNWYSNLAFYLLIYSSWSPNIAACSYYIFQSASVWRRWESRCYMLRWSIGRKVQFFVSFFAWKTGVFHIISLHSPWKPLLPTFVEVGITVFLLRWIIRWWRIIIHFQLDSYFH